MTVLIYHGPCNRWISKEHQHECWMSNGEIRARREARITKEREVHELKRWGRPA